MISSLSQPIYVPGKYSPSSCLSDKEEDEIYGFGYGIYGRQIAERQQRRTRSANQKNKHKAKSSSASSSEMIITSTATTTLTTTTSTQPTTSTTNTTILSSQSNGELITTTTVVGSSSSNGQLASTPLNHKSLLTATQHAALIHQQPLQMNYQRYTTTSFYYSEIFIFYIKREQ